MSLPSTPVIPASPRDTGSGICSISPLSMERWVGCIAGALDHDAYLQKLRNAGFVDASIEPMRVYRAEDAREFLTGKGMNVDEMAAVVDEKFFSGFARARKPA